MNRLRIKPLTCLAVLGLLCVWSVGGVSAQDANDAKEAYNLGLTAQQEGNYESAIMQYKAAIGADPDFVDAYLNLGAIYFEQKQYDDALNMFKVASDKDPKNIDALANVGRVQYKLRRYADAATAFQSGFYDGLDHLVRVHRVDDIGKGPVASFPDIIRDDHRVDQSVVSEDQTFLLLVKWHIMFIDDLLAAHRIDVEEGFYRLSPDHRFPHRSTHHDRHATPPALGSTAAESGIQYAHISLYNNLWLNIAHKCNDSTGGVEACWAQAAMLETTTAVPK